MNFNKSFNKCNKPVFLVASIAIVQATFFAIQLASTISSYYHTTTTIGISYAPHNNALMFSLTVFSLILALIAAILAVIGSCWHHSPYFLMPSLIMQFTLFVFTLLFAVYLLALLFGGTSLRVAAIFYEQSEQGERVLDYALNHYNPSKKLSWGRGPFPVVDVLAAGLVNSLLFGLLIFTLIAIPLQWWLFSVVLRAFRTFRDAELIRAKFGAQWTSSESNTTSSSGNSIGSSLTRAVTDRFHFFHQNPAPRRSFGGSGAGVCPVSSFQSQQQQFCVALGGGGGSSGSGAGTTATSLVSSAGSNNTQTDLLLNPHTLQQHYGASLISLLQHGVPSPASSCDSRAVLLRNSNSAHLHNLHGHLAATNQHQQVMHQQPHCWSSPGLFSHSSSLHYNPNEQHCQQHHHRRSSVHPPSVLHQVQPTFALQFNNNNNNNNYKVKNDSVGSLHQSSQRFNQPRFSLPTSELGIGSEHGFTSPYTNWAAAKEADHLSDTEEEEEEEDFDPYTVIVDGKGTAAGESVYLNLQNPPPQKSLGGAGNGSRRGSGVPPLVVNYVTVRRAEDEGSTVTAENNN